MTSKYTYWDNDGFAHSSCPICGDDDCEGHPGLVVVIPRSDPACHPARQEKKDR